MITLLFALATFQAPPVEVPELKPVPARAEVCYAHVEALIADAMAETGRVAGPSWFVRDWWGQRLDETQDTDERLATVRVWLAARRTVDAVAYDAERHACIQQAIEAGAVP